MNWLREMLSDNTDIISSKRVITLMAFLLCGMAFITDLFWGLTVDSRLYDAMMYIVVAGLGFTASEKFSKK